MRRIHPSVWWSSVWCDRQMLGGPLEQGIEALALECNRNERELCMMTALEMNVCVYGLWVHQALLLNRIYSAFVCICSLCVCVCAEQAEVNKGGRLLQYAARVPGYNVCWIRFASDELYSIEGSQGFPLQTFCPSLSALTLCFSLTNGAHKHSGMGVIKTNAV